MTWHRGRCWSPSLMDPSPKRRLLPPIWGMGDTWPPHSPPRFVAPQHSPLPAFQPPPLRVCGAVGSCLKAGGRDNGCGGRVRYAEGGTLPRRRRFWLPPPLAPPLARTSSPPFVPPTAPPLRAPTPRRLPTSWRLRGAWPPHRPPRLVAPRNSPLPACPPPPRWVHGPVGRQAAAASGCPTCCRPPRPPFLSPLRPLDSHYPTLLPGGWAAPDPRTTRSVLCLPCSPRRLPSNRLPLGVRVCGGPVGGVWEACRRGGGSIGLVGSTAGGVPQRCRNFWQQPLLSPHSPAVVPPSLSLLQPPPIPTT